MINKRKLNYVIGAFTMDGKFQYPVYTKKHDE